MNQGIIQQAQRSKSGKTLRMKINDTWYSTDNFALENAVGRNIQFNVGTSEYMGNTIYWANDAELVTDVDADVAPNNSAIVSQAAPQAPKGPDSHSLMALLPFTSNQVAHAIQAGLITKPDQIYDWARRAFNTAKSLVEGADEFDDDIPF